VAGSVSIKGVEFIGLLSSSLGFEEDSAPRPVAGSCEHGNEPSGSIKGGYLG
jgi:hypothetical protein